MTRPGRKTSRAGGSILALSILAGTVIGVFAHESSIGFLGGAALGLALLGAVWWIDRRR
jgi:uncharacterized membrane protein (UPF0136 family)